MQLAKSFQWKSPYFASLKEADGVLCCEMVPQGETVNVELCCNIVGCLRENIERIQSELWRAPAQRALRMQEVCGQTNSIPLLLHSQNMSPCNFIHFLKVKEK